MQLCNYRKYVLYELQICVASILDCYEASQWKKEVSHLEINCVEAYVPTNKVWGVHQNYWICPCVQILSRQYLLKVI